MSNATWTKTATAKTWTSANGAIRVTAQATKKHGKWCTLYTATLNAGTPNWKDLGSSHTLSALAALPTVAVHL